MMMICEMLAERGTRDVFNFCMASKYFNEIGTAILYRRVSLGPWVSSNHFEWLRSRRQEHPVWKMSGDLADRLLGFPNQTLRAPNILVRELTITCDLKRNFAREVAQGGRKHATRLFESRFVLAKLVKSLPNLMRLRIGFPHNFDDALLQALNNHPVKIDIHLLEEHGQNTVCQKNVTLPWVSTMTIYVDHNVKFHLRLNPLKALILQCPNLKRLSIDEKLDSLFYKQPIGHMPYVIRPKFPPIESIYMNSANVLVDNAWKPEFQFDKLVSLFIGRRCMGWPLVLGMGAAGNFWNLKSFSFDYPVRNIALGDGDGLHLCLLGMPLLETLYVKNFPCSARSLTHLGCLKKLGLLYDEPYIWQPVAAGAQPGLGGHAFSTFMVMLSHVRHAHVPGRPMFPTIGTPTRNALSLDELDDLDMNCPDLRMLKLEADRGINSWPYAFLDKLAAKFPNLEYLSLHFQLRGLSGLSVQKPILNYSSALSIGRYFFERKWNGKFRKLIVKTGDKKPLTGEEIPCREQRSYASTFVMLRPAKKGGDPVFIHVEREEMGPHTDLKDVGLANSDAEFRIAQAVHGIPPDQPLTRALSAGSHTQSRI